MLDHIRFPVSDFLAGRNFHQAVLEPLGTLIAMEVTAEQTGGSSHAGSDDNGNPHFWNGAVRRAPE
jgi:hypothetical protein